MIKKIGKKKEAEEKQNVRKTRGERERKRKGKERKTDIWILQDSTVYFTKNSVFERFLTYWYIMFELNRN